MDQIVPLDQNVQVQIIDPSLCIYFLTDQTLSKMNQLE